MIKHNIIYILIQYKKYRIKTILYEKLKGKKMTITAKNLELSILAKLIQDSSARDEIIESVDSDFFEKKDFKKVYEENFKEGDFEELSFKLHIAGVSPEIAEELFSLPVHEISTTEVINIYRNVYANRLIIEGLKSTESVGLDENIETLKAVQERVEEINTSSSDITLPNEALDLYLTELAENQARLRDNPDGIMGKSTGSDKLDKEIEGIGNQDYILLAARPSMGKTSAMIKMINATILKEDAVCVVFSLETSLQHLLARIISQINTNIKLKHAMFGRDAETMTGDIHEVVEMLRSKKLYIEDFHKASSKDAVTPTPAQFSTTLKKIEKIEGKIGLVIVDHIGLMSASRKGLAEGNATVTSISRELRMMTRQFDCPWVVLSQLNRELEKRIDKRPKLSDLRDSGALEQDADKIIFIYRDFIYRMAELKEQIKQKPEDVSLQRALTQLMRQEIDAAEYIIAKNRNGPLSTVDLFFERKNASFIDDIEDYNLDEMFGAQDVYQ